MLPPSIRMDAPDRGLKCKTGHARAGSLVDRDPKLEIPKIVVATAAERAQAVFTTRLPADDLPVRRSTTTS